MQPQEDTQKAQAQPNEEGFKLVEKTPEEAPYYKFGEDRVLAYAWELYETYSNGSSGQKTQNSSVRQIIIILIFLTSTLAVFGSLPGMEIVHGLFLAILQWLGWTILFNWLTSFGPQIMSTILIILSVATTAMLSYASQFTPMKAWIMYRVGADRIRSEIYLYRLLAGRYKGMQPGSVEIRKEFLRQIENINRQIYELETAPPFLQHLEENKSLKVRPSNPRVLLNRALFPFRLIMMPIRWVGRVVTGTRRSSSGSSGSSGSRRRLSGRYYGEHDDGFNKLSGEAYLKYRAIPQRDWYVDRVYEDYAKIKDYRIVLLTIGGASAVLAAIQREPYIVITTAAAVAINTHIQLNLIGSTYGNYHVTASRLDSEIVRWQNLDNREAPEEVSRFVENIERILEEERVIWMQQASQAQKETEQNLIKGAGKREGLPSIDSSQYIDDLPTTRTTPPPTSAESQAAPNGGANTVPTVPAAPATTSTGKPGSSSGGAQSPPSSSTTSTGKPSSSSGGGSSSNK